MEKWIIGGLFGKVSWMLSRLLQVTKVQSVVHVSTFMRRQSENGGAGHVWMAVQVFRTYREMPHTYPVREMAAKTRANVRFLYKWMLYRIGQSTEDDLTLLESFRPHSHTTPPVCTPCLLLMDGVDHTDVFQTSHTFFQLLPTL